MILFHKEPEVEGQVGANQYPFFSGGENEGDLEGALEGALEVTYLKS